MNARSLLKEFRLQYISDLHLEFRSWTRSLIQRIEPANVLVLAGDICTPQPQLTSFLDYCCQQWPDVIYVAGNHEFYGSSRQQALSQINRWNNLHYLDRDIVTIDGQRYLGCTLWSQPKFTSGLNDYNMIEELRTGKANMSEWHQQDVDWLKSNVRSDDIVVTHFMPMTTADLIELGHNSVYPASKWDSYFGNTDCRDLFSRKPKLWISGHTHQHFNVLVDGVPWVCNPLGYPGENI